MVTEVTAEHIPCGIGSTVKGVVVPTTELYEITANTSDGEALKADKLHLTSSSGSIGKPDVAKFSALQVTILDDSGSRLPAGIEVFAAPFNWEVFNRMTKPGEKSPLFTDDVAGRWLEIEKTGVTAGLRSEKDKWLHLKINSKASGELDMVKHAAAFLDVLSFYAGRRLECMAYTQYSEHSKTTTLVDYDTHLKTKFYPPLPRWDDEATITLLDRGIDFFLKKDCGPVLTALHVCWESRRLSLAASQLLVCSVVEGLADYICNDAVTQCKALRDLALDLLRKEGKAKESLYWHEVENSFREVKFLKGVESIKQAAKLLQVSVTMEELAAWSSSRHKLAHGKFTLNVNTPEEIQSVVDQAARVANIINKFVLALIRYEGEFCDYSIRGQPGKPFPPQAAR